MAVKMKRFLFTLIISFLLNNSGGYLTKTSSTTSQETGNFSPASVYAITIDYKVCPSCKIYFTHKVRTDIENNNLDIKTIQYYNSGDIILSRLIKKDRHQASTGGVVKYRSGKLTEEITINRFTPGVCVRYDEDTLYMSFGKDKSFILPFKKNRGYYELDNKGDHIKVSDHKFKVLKGRTSILVIQKYDTKTGRIRKKTLKGRMIKN